MTKFKISSRKVTLQDDICFVAQNFVAQSDFARRFVFHQAKFHHARGFFLLVKVRVHNHGGIRGNDGRAYVSFSPYVLALLARDATLIVYLCHTSFSR